MGKGTILAKTRLTARIPRFFAAINRTLSFLPPYQFPTVVGVQTAWGSSRWVRSLGNGFPLIGGRPRWPAVRGGGGANRLASSRSRLQRARQHQRALGHNADAGPHV